MPRSPGLIQMFLETKEIGPEGLAVDRHIELPGPLPLEGEDVVEVARARLTGDLMRERGGISFAGDIETGATLRCSRCLETYDLPLSLHFDLLYTTDPETVDGDDGRIDDESASLALYDGSRIDLTALLREQVYLGLPLKPLCRPDCRGLCPRCGANLNAGACGCPEERAGETHPGRSKLLL